MIKKLKDIFNKLINPSSRALMDAVCLGNARSLERLISRGGNPDAKDTFGNPLLCSAALWKKREMIHILLKNGANPSITDNRGWSALHWTVANNDVITIRSLLEAGADVNAQNNFGFSPLLMARTAYPSSNEVIEKFLTEKQKKDEAEAKAATEKKTAEQRRIAESIATAAVLKQDLKICKPFRLKNKKL